MADVEDPTVVDARGTPCPVPVIELAKAVRDLAPGAQVVLLADDVGAKVDVPVWCRMKGHTYRGADDADEGWAFRITVR